MTRHVDILISGGGVAGLAAAAAFGAAGYSVVCAEPNPPVTDEAADGADLRTTAFLQPSRDVLMAAGLWARLEAHATPLQIMRIIDAGGAVQAPRLVKDFDASDISDLPFGWNVPNWLLRREMVAQLQDLASVEFMPGVATVGLLTRSAEALVRLSDGSQVAARLVVAADGRGSTMRQALGIGVRTFRYGQKALTFAVTHEAPHRNVSTEIHRSGGPFTLVPLPDRNGLPCSAVVWMERGPEAARLLALDVEAFEAEIDARSCGVLGRLKLASKRLIWPMIAHLADRMVGERVALMAEAAHVVPPIGAQGLNMSLADLAALLELGRTHELGSAAMLAAYQRRRYLEVEARVLGIDALNRASMVETQGLRDLRALALNGLYGVAPLRRVLMKAGLGARG